MTNCPNCGAPITSSACEYCGTVHRRSRESDDMVALLKHANDCIQKSIDMQALYDEAIYAMRGYSYGVYTANEARALMGLPRI